MSTRNYYTGKYSLDKHEYLTAKHYALRYRKWKDEYKALEDSSRAIRYDVDRVQTSNNFDPVSANAERRAELDKRIHLIEDTARETDGQLFKWILQGVTDEYATFKYLSSVKHIPCGRRQYYERRRRFFYLLSQKL